MAFPFRLPSGRAMALAAALCLYWSAQAADAPVQMAVDGGRLHGSLNVPLGASTPVPTVLLIAGSGPTDRDGNSALMPGRNDSLKWLAQALEDAGIASLRYDKRGVAASQAAGGPDEAQLRIETYADDVCRWLDWLAQDRRLGRVAIVGHSEGALIGLLAARQCPGKAGAYISLAGVGSKAADVIRWQLQQQAVSERVRERSEGILQSLENGQTTEPIPPSLHGMFRPSVQPYLISWFRYDPAQELAQLRLPTLIVHGDTDIQVSVQEARKLAAAQPAAQWLIVPGMNHVLKTAPLDLAQQQSTYTNPDLPLPGSLTQPLIGFLKRHLQVGR